MTKTMRRAMGAAVLAMVTTGAAGAQPAHGAPTPRDQEFTFGDQLVQGALPRPDDVTVRGRPRAAQPSLIRHRAHFVPEMLRSVERL